VAILIAGVGSGAIVYAQITIDTAAREGAMVAITIPILSGLGRLPNQLHLLGQ